jgi:hypothetical protein
MYINGEYMLMFVVCNDGRTESGELKIIRRSEEEEKQINLFEIISIVRLPKWLCNYPNNPPRSAPNPLLIFALSMLSAEGVN